MKPICYYKEKEDQTLCLLRIFGESSVVQVPSQIDGKTVTEIGPYCFAQSRRFSGPQVRKNVSDAEEDRIQPYIHEQSGKYIRRVILPDTITRIANCAFYNCGSLQEISLASSVEEIGSDVFMNCIRLDCLTLRADVRERTALKQMLAQITWNVEVRFECGGITQAGFFFPEYYEGYDEIGPAHIFELNISGEGFRTRQCFQDNRIRIREYDDIFPQACIEEPPEVLSRYALDRLAYPWELAEENRQSYRAYVKENQKEIGRKLLADRRMEPGQKLYLMEVMIREGCLETEALEDLISLAAERNQAELSASLIAWRAKYFRKRVRSRYTFDEF